MDCHKYLRFRCLVAAAVKLYTTSLTTAPLHNSVSNVFTLTVGVLLNDYCSLIARLSKVCNYVPTICSRFYGRTYEAGISGIPGL